MGEIFKHDMEKYIYIVYLTINSKNNKMYIGVHKQLPYGFDGYIGNGIAGKDSKFIKHPKTPFHYAVKKHGYKAFKRYTLAEFDSEDLAYNLEKEIVNKSWVDRKDTYNIKLGGKGGWDHIKVSVLKYSMNGDFLEEYESVSLAAMYTKHAGRSEIAQACKDLSKSSGGFRWRYKISNNIPQKINPAERYNGKSKAVLQYTLEGDFVAEFSSMRRAAMNTKANAGEIARVCKTEKGQSGGFRWRFKVGDEIKQKIKI